MEAIRCEKCSCIYLNEMSECPSCKEPNPKARYRSKYAKSNQTQPKAPSSNVVQMLVKQAEEHPDKAVTCFKCGIKYPNTLKSCPKCGSNNSGGYVASTKNNTIYNKPKNRNLVDCMACGHQISTRAESCPHCGNPTGVHVCPKCDSINTRVITGTSKATSIFLWGAFAANKVVSKYECKDCGHKF